MKTFARALKLIVAGSLTFVALTGCESTDGGGAQISGGLYYGTGFYDPWYYGGYYDDVDIIVTPPDRPTTPPPGGGTAPPRPSHPIARPPSPAPRPMPMPSIPSMPRVSGRR